MRRADGRPGSPDLTTLAAAKFVESHGREALRILDERAELAEELGHKVATKTWREMADAAARLLNVERDAATLPADMMRRLPRVWLR